MMGAIMQSERALRTTRSIAPTRFIEGRWRFRPSWRLKARLPPALAGERRADVLSPIGTDSVIDPGPLTATLTVRADVLPAVLCIWVLQTIDV